MPEITLYQYEECPFCAKVRAFLNEMKIKFKKINVSYDHDDSLRKKLFKESGVKTVPVIEFAGEFIGESEKIIRFVEQKILRKN
ncbi:MAG: glutaredoxin domain-containing protein [archaeon]|nr:glutaredoxin domain-containing protein [archaeon]